MARTDDLGILADELAALQRHVANNGTHDTPVVSRVPQAGVVPRARADGTLDPAWLPARSGTAFPPQPTQGQLFFRTDRGIDYYWDGQRWLSTIEVPFVLSSRGVLMPFTAPAIYNGIAHDIIDPSWAVFWTRMVMRVYVSTTSDASNYWTLNVGTQTDTGAAARTFWSFTTANIPANTTAYMNGPVNIVGASNERLLYSTAVKTGTPGATWADLKAWYRLIGA